MATEDGTNVIIKGGAAIKVGKAVKRLGELLLVELEGEALANEQAEVEKLHKAAVEFWEATNQYVA